MATREGYYQPTPESEARYADIDRRSERWARIDKAKQLLPNDCYFFVESLDIDADKWRYEFRAQGFDVESRAGEADSLKELEREFYFCLNLIGIEGDVEYVERCKKRR